MDIHGPFILLRVYLDAFATNNPLGSSSDRDKIMGFYYSCLWNLLFGAQRKTIQTLAILYQSDIDYFGLNFCLQETMSDLKKLVNEGIFCKRTNRHIQVRVIACLGDNLEQVHVAGMKQNFSTMPHACRKCLCSRNDLNSAERYSDIHSNNFQPRTDEMFQNNYLEAKERRVGHINGVGNQSLFFDFPYFSTSNQLPQCSSHDFLEGCSKVWLKIILEHLIKQNWFNWEGFERMITSFKFRGKDADNRYIHTYLRML